MSAQDAFNEAVVQRLRIRKQTARPRITHAELAEAMGVASSTVRRYLDGEREMQVWDFFVLAEAMDLDPLQVLREARRAARDAGEAERWERAKAHAAAHPVSAEERASLDEALRRIGLR